MTDFEALKRQAKEREEGVRKVFVNYDHDKSDSIDMMELTCLLDDLGLYEKIKTDKTTFVAEMFAEFDKNGDGVLSFEEFKGVYNRAKDNAAGRKPAPMTRAKTQSGLDSTMETERKRVAAESAKKKAAEAEEMLKANREMKANLAAKGGKDSKELDQTMKQKRAALAAEKKAKKEAEARRIKEENARMKAKIKNTKAATDNDLLDDVAADGTSVADARKKKAADGEAARDAERRRSMQSAKDLKEMKKNAVGRDDKDLLDDVAADGTSIAEMRRQKAAEGDAARKAEEARYKQSAKDLDKMKKEAVGRDDKDLLDDVVGGVSVAEARKQKAAEGDAARKAEEARYKQSAKDLDTMKKNAVGKDDKDINDDIVGGVNIGEARKQKAREGEEARQAEEDRYKQSAKDLAAMKKNTAARTDHDLLDDPV